MIFPVQYLQGFFESLTFPIVVKQVVEGAENTTFLVRGGNTQYVNERNKIVFDDVALSVQSVVQGESFVVSGIGHGITTGTKYLKGVSFFHGFYLDAKKRIAAALNADTLEARNIMPLVYLIEPMSDLSQTGDVRSAFEWEGRVRLFIANQTSWSDLPSEHYSKNIISLGAVVDRMQEQYSRYFKVDTPPELSHKTFPKFATNDPSISKTKGEQVFGQHLSAIEITMSCPIIKC